MPNSTTQIETDWVSAPRSIRGQDQLGCQAPCELTYSQLLPGITNVTDRARYFSFYPWVAWSLDKRFPTISEERYVELYRRADCLYTLIAAQESKISENVRQAEAMIGRLRLLPALDRLTSGTPLRLSDYATQEESEERYFKNRMGGLGQITSARSLNSVFVQRPRRALGSHTRRSSARCWQTRSKPCFHRKLSGLLWSAT